jgi:MFS transporter, MHS family, proline/betaine transporter
MKAKAINKTIIICGIGSALEWYDFALFGLLSTAMSGIFFQTENKSMSLLLIFMTFASGFFMRPIGAIYFGWIGDRYGRKAALSTTIILMALSTTMIGLAPTYAKVGIAAPIFVIFMRLVQGFSASGEYPNAISLITEMSPPQQRGFYGSFSVVGVVAGMLLSSIMVSLITVILSKDMVNSWGWRFPFLLSAPLGILGFYLRYNMQESPVFQEMLRKNKLSEAPLLDIWNKKIKSTFVIFSIFLFSTVAFYTIFIYLKTYLVNVEKISLQFSSFINVINISIMVVLIPFFGKISDYYGRKAVMTYGIIGNIIFTYPVFLMIINGSIFSIFVGQMIFAILLSIFVGPMAAFSMEQLPANIRTSGISLGLNFSASLLGGTAPLVATYLVHIFKTPIAPCFYLIICAFISLFAISNVMENRKIKTNLGKCTQDLLIENKLI